jgi:zinc transport system substrate-binding protein
MNFKTLIFSLLLLFNLSCESSLNPIKSDKKNVVVSIAPYHYFVERIAGSLVNIHTIVPPGASPHSYEPPPQSMKGWSNAQLWITCGESFEKKISPVLLDHNPKLLVCDSLEGLSLLTESCCHDSSHHHHHSEACSHNSTHHHVHAHNHDALDTHVWLSPRLAKIQAQHIAKYLMQAFPKHRDEFKQGLQEFLTDLNEADEAIEQQLRSSQGRAIFVSHPAFAYFCQDYGLKQFSLEQEGKDPLPKQLISLMNSARKENIQHIYLQKQYNNKPALCVAEELDITTLFVDPYSSDYLNNLKDIAQKFSLEVNPKQ